MCGLVGAFNPLQSNVVDNDTLQKMRDRMAHRGPDGAGLWRSSDGGCALAHRRLAIIDLGPHATQPMRNREQSVAVVFNGEIYNHQEIRKQLEALGKYHWQTDHSDTEVLLHAYQEWGMDCVEKFYGMFSFAVYDARNPDRPQLNLVRDRMGVKPLYLARTDQGEWLFASEIKAFFAHPRMTPEMSNSALWHYLTFVVAPAPLTLFKGVYKVPAGWRIHIDHQGHAKAAQWWTESIMNTERLRESDISEQQAADELLSLLRTSVSRRMVSDVPFGALLSGGIDSSLIVALMAEQMDRPVTTFSVGYENEPAFNELDQARKVAKKFSTKHHETLITTRDAQNFIPEMVRLQDEPVADNVCIPLYFLSALVRQQGVPVVQVGEGADEHFLGYWWCAHYRAMLERSGSGNDLSGWIKSQWMRLRGHVSDQEAFNQRKKNGEPLFWGGAVSWWGEMRGRLTPNPGLFKGGADCPVDGLLPPPFAEPDSARVVTAMMAGHRDTDDILPMITFLEQRMRLPEHLLMRVDKMTMAHSVEARVPFLDHDVVRFAGKLPLSYKLKDNTGKYILKKAANGILDEETIVRKKQGFGAPMDHWLRQPDFSARCKAVLERSRLVRDGLIDKDYMNALMRDHVQSSSGYGSRIWTVLNAMIWHDYWIEGHEECF